MAKKMAGKELVSFARSKIGTPYVYGAKGEVLTLDKYNYLKKQYGSMVWVSDISKVGKVCVDCSGLISWACGVSLGSSQWMERASVKKPISSVREAPVGALVWMQGHIGIYTGLKNGVPYYVAADGSAYGVREVPVSYNKFTHWLLVTDIFEQEDDDEVEKVKRSYKYGDKTVTFDVVVLDDHYYIQASDIATLFGKKVSFDNATKQTEFKD